LEPAHWERSTNTRVVLLTIHHGLCILEQLCDCSEQWDADNAKEPKLQQQRAKHRMSGTKLN
jgi:hypothetical protein